MLVRWVVRVVGSSSDQASHGVHESVLVELALEQVGVGPGVEAGDVAGPMEEAAIEAAVAEALAPFDREEGENPYDIQRDLQEMMQANVGIVRVESEMQAALEGIQKFKVQAQKVQAPANREYNPGWHTCMDLQNMLVCAEACTLGALERKESRGGHFREDFPDKDPEAQKYNSVISKAADGSMKLRREPIPPLPEPLKQVIEEMKN